MKKKFFNLAVILATVMSSAVFSSCDKDDDDDNKTPEEQKKDDEKEVNDDIKNDDVEKVSEIQVEAGKTYEAFQNEATAFKFKVVSTDGSLAKKTQVVVIDIVGTEYTLSDQGDSYLMKDGDVFKTVGQKEANDNASKIVMVLALANSKKDFTITSGKVNTTLNENGAVETLFVAK